MKLKIKFPIRNKLLLLMSALVIFSIVTYLSLAIKLFKDDKTTLIYELNSSYVRTLGAEMKSEFQNVVAKVNLLTQGHQNSEWVNIILGSDEDLLAFALYDREHEAAPWRREVFLERAKSYLALYGQTPEALEKIEQTRPFPLDRAFLEKTWIQNATLESGAPLIQLGVSVALEGAPRPKVAVATLRLDRLLKQLGDVRSRGISTVYVVNGAGEVIGHPDAKLVQDPSALTGVAVVKSALSSGLELEMKEFKEGDTSQLAAYANVGFAGLRVISQIPQEEAVRAALRLVNKSLLFALLIVTIALWLSIALAKSLTEPLSRLVEATEKITQWKIAPDEKIEVKTNDEVAELAVAFNAMAQDLRQQREQIDRHQAELEDKVRERTADLETQKKRVAEANEKLVKTTRLASLGELAGAAAHEVLNPMNNINIRLERMKKQVFGQEAQDFDLVGKVVEGWSEAYRSGGWEGLRAALSAPVEGGSQTLLDEDLVNLGAIIADTKKRMAEKDSDFRFLEREVVRITKIVNNMRSLSRVGGERSKLDVKEAIEDAVAVLSDIGEKQKTVIQVERSEEAGRARVLADRDELVQVFSNLIRNAFHAIRAANQPAGTVKVDTRIGPQGRVEVRVIDNGTGIEAHHLDRIFEADFTTKSVQEGTGLGLSISRRIVRAFGGDLEVESTEIGKGTVFLAWFPQATAEGAQSA